CSVWDNSLSTLF
nr:immunoglobulin light chain junction region [Macaca mulatta]MPN65568.1 immunoglobulin light chain junction region [Macaca mulatta]MPN65586.1 immunoglobulin light chain junction region [Macaca mulatta]MPN65752.1 immunoglobulin light chain junction region [Macaca mulatta]MPN65753.1 immunoglobulin light chain junction region [Macaca mulatta]